MIQERVDQKRGCGWRKPGGLYLVNDGQAQDCGRLPIPLEKCPTCSGGIHFARGWTWVNGYALMVGHPCKLDTTDCIVAPFGPPCILSTYYDNQRRKLERCGLLWIGEKFYKSPTDFMEESRKFGVSRRIPAVPNDFKVGETIVLLAHISAITKPCVACLGAGTIVVPGNLKLDDKPVEEEKPPVSVKCQACDGAGKTYHHGIFSAFVPKAVEYVTKGDETPEELAALERRGIIPVKVVRAEGAMGTMGDA